MTRSILDVLALAVDGDPVDLADHALGDGPGTDVHLALQLGWASLPPGLADHLTPPGDVIGDLDAHPSDVLAAVLVAPADSALDTMGDEHWGAGDDAAGDVDGASLVHELDAAAAPVAVWAEHDLDDLSSSDTHHAGHEATAVADDDDGPDDDDADPWDDALL